MFIIKQVFSAVVIFFLLGCSLSAHASSEKFNDLNPKTELGFVVSQLASQGVINGYPDNTYRPQNQVTRGQVAALIDRALNLPEKAEGKTFVDVPSNHTHAKSIQKVQQAGIMDGYPDQTFKPEAALTRAQLAKILSLAFDLPISQNASFKDVATTHWAKEYINSMASTKITVGANGNYMPNDSVTRGQYARFMYRAISWAAKENEDIVKEGIVVQPLPTNLEPEVAPTPTPSGNKTVGVNGVTKNNIYSPFVPQQKNAVGEMVINGQAVRYGLPFKPRPYEGEVVKGSTGHWFNTPKTRIVVNGVELPYGRTGTYYHAELKERLSFNLEVLVPLLGGKILSSTDKKVVVEYKEKQYTVDYPTKTINEKKVSYFMEQRNDTIYVERHFFTDELGVFFDYQSEKLEHYNYDVIYLGTKTLIQPYYVDDLNNSLYGTWNDLSTYELKSNGYYAPKAFVVRDYGRTTKNSAEDISDEFSLKFYDLFGSSPVAFSTYVGTEEQEDRLYARLSTYEFPDFTQATWKNKYIHELDSKLKFALGEQGGLITAKYLETITSGAYEKARYNSIVATMKLEGRTVYFVKNTPASSLTNYNIFISHKGKTIDFSYLKHLY